MTEDLLDRVFRRRLKSPPASVDLSIDAPRTGGPVEPAPMPSWFYDEELRRLRRDGRAAPPLRRAQQNSYLARAVVEEANRPGVDVASIPLNRTRVAATSLQGEVRYATEPRSLNELYEDVGRVTGVRSGFLRDLARKESSEDYDARPDTSSAYGLTQFTEGTWRNVTERHGARFGYPAYANDAEHLGRRADPRWSLAFAAALAEDNAAALAARTGNAPSEQEVYLAHFAGSAVAGDLVEASHTWRASLPAANFVPTEYVSANRNVFFDGDRARSVREVITTLGRGFSSRPWGRTAQTASAPNGNPSRAARARRG